ncbi:MAG TPA: 16S rRNA (uracil(1498)-N(3))-methyltransferase [Saprospiraceae bacterium]|nr:16S rRNA (uracil(1498)-N(3))-methyltransferase [Saprospiraceae bacterium]HMQ83175.1 16S rRNA (uracil(1498)-N(3))-methyltransferase [Saprospiraceae bacterium]
MQLFFTTDITDNIAILPEEEARHCFLSLRKKVGDLIQVVDGQGGFYQAQIITIDKKSCQAKVVDHQMGYGKRDCRIHLAVAPTKNMDRIEWLLEKATELGIDEVTLLLCDHSERRQVKMERLEKLLIAAMKQSVQAYLPRLNPLTPFADFVIQQKGVNQQNFIAHCHSGDKGRLKGNYQPGQNVCMLIGPEGDFSTDEVALALANDFFPISLGTVRLRTETAGLVVLHSVHFVNEEIG